MAFDISAALGYGSGTLGAVTNPSGQINSYARVTAIDGKVITIGTPSNGVYEKFVVGSEVLFYVAQTLSSSTSYLGKWHVLKITAVSGSAITVNKKVLTLSKFSSLVLADYVVQLVTIAQFKSLTLSSGEIAPPAFNGSCGGIIAFKCSTLLTLSGGNINLKDKGLQSAHNRPLLNQESDGTCLTDKHCGWENYACLKRITLNKFDGAAFIITKQMKCSATSRIGNPNVYGIARTPTLKRFADNADGEINRGGSSILIAAETITDFNVKMIAKYRVQSGDPDSACAGLGRCYIATESYLPCDEGLYAYDRISNPSRLSENFNIKDFGDGSDGTKTNLTTQYNNYAAITEMNEDRNIFTIANKTTAGLAKFKVGALVMIHGANVSSSYYKCGGRFYLTKIIGIKSTKITVDSAIPKWAGFTPAHYAMQMITIPQFNSFTLGKDYTATPKFEKGRGGICAIAVKETCDLKNGRINVIGKGGALATPSLKCNSNAAMADKLPLGEGNGSVFILANNMIMNGATRIGSIHSGAEFGGKFSCLEANANDSYMSKNGYQGYNMDNNTTGGSGKAGGLFNNGFAGGFGSNAKNVKGSNGLQGAHVMIVANKITDFYLSAIATGGMPGYTGKGLQVPTAGGASYGGGGGSYGISRSGKKVWNYGTSGGFVGGGAGSGDEDGDNLYGGGGSGGFAFVYCNERSNQIVTGLSID